MELRELIRDTLREKMESQYKTLTAFAKASGVSQSYLSKIFGEVAVDISPTILSKLLSPLGVSLSQFFTDVEKKKAVLLDNFLIFPDRRCRIPAMRIVRRAHWVTPKKKLQGMRQ